MITAMPSGMRRRMPRPPYTPYDVDQDAETQDQQDEPTVVESCPAGLSALGCDETSLDVGTVPVSWPCMPLQSGERLRGTPYVVTRSLGHGGMGEVYEVEHAELGRSAAIKVLHRRHGGRPDLIARMREEARVMASLRHPNVIEVFDLGVLPDGRPYFAMPALRGSDLRIILGRSNVIPVDTAIELMIQALDGLSAVHAAGFVHRDVKLENLFLQEDGTVKVLDFGVARERSDRNADIEPWGTAGTPRTMAPEQCVGGAIDCRTDLYTVGLALYELCAGRGPFDELRGNDHALRFAHCERSPPPLSHAAPQAIEPELDGVVCRALAKIPGERFQSAAEMSAALQRLRAQRGLRSSLQRVPKRWLSILLPWAALAVAVVVAFAGGWRCCRLFAAAM